MSDTSESNLPGSVNDHHREEKCLCTIIATPQTPNISPMLRETYPDNEHD